MMEMICGHCRDQLISELKLSESYLPSPPWCGASSGYRLTSLWSYSGIISQLIRAIKIQANDALAAMLVSKIMAEIPALPWLQDIDAVAAVSPSFYSRITGKLDLAQVLCNAVCRKLSKPQIKISSMARHKNILKKRSQQAERGWSLDDIRAPKLRNPQKNQPVETKRVLVIDDVCTSGFTLVCHAASLPCCEVRLFSIASALRANTVLY
jgi:predicted amidophosphoribosyltransferase